MMQDREYWLRMWRKIPDARYARERIKQIDRMIDRIKTMNGYRKSLC